MRKFSKSFTQQEPISEVAIAHAVEVMRTGRLHRYNTLEGEESEAALLEHEFARNDPSCSVHSFGVQDTHDALNGHALFLERLQETAALEFELVGEMIETNGHAVIPSGSLPVPRTASRP